MNNKTNNKPAQTPTDQDLEKIKAENRRKYPELAKLVDRLAAAFGPVKVVHMEGNWRDATADDGATDHQEKN